MKILKFSNSDWVNCTKNNTDRVDNKHLLIEYTISGHLMIEYVNGNTFVSFTEIVFDTSVKQVHKKQ